jgi:hypothetical protein
MGYERGVWHIYLRVFVHMIGMVEGIIGVFLDDDEMRYDAKSR